MANIPELKKSRTSIAQFNLVGEVKINDYTFTIDQTSDKSDWIWNTLNLGVDCGDCGTIYAEMKSGYGSNRDNVVYVHGKKESENDSKKLIDDFSNQYTIDWDDRFKKSILDDIGNRCFIKVGIEKDVKDKTVEKLFLTAYDAVIYIKEHLEDGMIVNVKGNLKWKEYEGKTQLTKEITSIFLSGATPEKYRATFRQTILCGYDCIGKLNNETESYALDAYVVDYVGKLGKKQIKKSFAYDKQFEFATRGDEEKAKKILVKYFKPKKKNEVAEVNVEGRITKNGTSVDITMEDIPDEIQELIDLGLYTKEEILAKGTNGGNKKETFVIEKPVVVVTKDDDGNSKTEIQSNKSAWTTDSLLFFSSLDLDEDNEDADEDKKSTKSKVKEKEDKSSKAKIDDDFDLDDLFDDDDEDDLPF